jgi:predicted ferric reductase
MREGRAAVGWPGGRGMRAGELDRLAVRSGQYFVWRFLTRDGWWRRHPFSISSAPNGSWLRITVKELGDWSAQLRRMVPGTRVFVEGPYGILTGARRTRQGVLLIAGGIGITPIRALLEALPARAGDLTLLYRVRHEHDIERDVFVCGPVPMMQHVEASLRRLGLPPRQIHAERFACCLRRSFRLFQRARRIDDDHPAQGSPVRPANSATTAAAIGGRP